MDAPGEAQRKGAASSSTPNGGAGTPGDGTGRRSGRRFSARTGWFLAALAVFSLSTLIAFTQAPRPEVYRAPTWADRLRYPIERNAFLRLPVLPTGLNDIFALPGADRLWVVGDRGFIAYSDDRGRTWTQDTSLVRRFQERARQGEELAAEESTGEQVQQEAARRQPQEDRPLVSRSAMIQQPVQQKAPPDEGASDSTPGDREASGPAVPDLHAVFFADAQHGWAVGTGGTILTTDDGGQSWQVQEAPTPNDLNDVYFADTRTGWAVGQTHTVLRTSDGGASWVPAEIQFTRGGYSQFTGGGYGTTSLRAVHFIDVNTGWAVGDNGFISGNGFILKSLDGGETWRTQASPDLGSLGSLHDIYFVNARSGWAVGDGGLDRRSAILKTTDGGANWQLLEASDELNASTLYSVHFTDTQAGWAVGHSQSSPSRSIIVHTADGGATWQSQNLPSFYPVLSRRWRSPQRPGRPLQDRQRRGVLAAGANTSGGHRDQWRALHRCTDRLDRRRRRLDAQNR